MALSHGVMYLVDIKLGYWLNYTIMKPAENKNYQQLLDTIGTIFQQHKSRAISQASQEKVKAYWAIGQHIVEYEQEGKVKAEYGRQLLIRLTQDLKPRLGKGFSRSNLYLMRQFYLKYPKIQTVSGKLSWSHFSELLSISDDLERSFYEQQILIEKWSVRELKRQKETALFHRLALSKDKAGILKLAKKGHQIQTPDDLSKDPYIFEVRHGTIHIYS